MPIVKTITMYKEQLCSRCGFKISRGNKGYDIGEGKILLNEYTINPLCSELVKRMEKLFF